MVFISSAINARAIAFTDKRAAHNPSAGRGFFRWLVAAMMTARTRAAEREITRYLQRTGGKFTDEAEREIERRFLSNRQGW